MAHRYLRIALAAGLTLGLVSCGGTGHQEKSADSKEVHALDDAHRAGGISTAGNCEWLSASEIETAVGDAVIGAQDGPAYCNYFLGFPRGVASGFGAPPMVYESNREPGQPGVVGSPSPIPNLGVDAYCITIEATNSGGPGEIPGGGRINVKLPDNGIYQIWGTYSCEQLLPLAKIAVSRH